MQCFDWLTRFRYVLGAGVCPLLGRYSAMASLLITKLTMKYTECKYGGPL